MESMYYPTGNSTSGRTIVCMCCEADAPIMEDQESPDSIESKIKSWLDENNYCVEKWQMDEKMKSCGCDGYELQEMEGGAPADGGGGAFATLGTTQGMGNVQAPVSGGTNADFYSGAVGSGDKFPSLTVGTPAAGNGKKKKKKDRVVKSFEDFKAMMKSLQK
jgi:hypothetical protein